MKRLSPVRSRRMAAAAFLVAGSAMNHAADVNPRRSSHALRHAQVAAIDITQSFRCHPGVVRAMDELKGCRAVLADQMVAARRELHEARQRLGMLDPESEAHRLVAARIARREAQLRERIERARCEFRQQQSRIYDATYDALVDTIAQYTQIHDFTPNCRAESGHAAAQRS
ncbi:MAG: hypothetical protein HUU20_03370 [Pirellulales bacterium]|nr:hypothetical protein [Pirellulales bacterium]